MNCYIEIDGCHDATRLVLPLTDAQYAFVKRLADRIEQASRDGCQPIMVARPATMREINSEYDYKADPIDEDE